MPLGYLGLPGQVPEPVPEVPARQRDAGLLDGRPRYALPDVLVVGEQRPPPGDLGNVQGLVGDAPGDHCQVGVPRLCLCPADVDDGIVVADGRYLPNVDVPAEARDSLSRVGLEFYDCLLFIRQEREDLPQDGLPDARDVRLEASAHRQFERDSVRLEDRLDPSREDSVLDDLLQIRELAELRLG